MLLTKTRLKEKLAKLEEEVKRLAAIEKALLASPDKQISLTDPDCRSMATSGRGSGMTFNTCDVTGQLPSKAFMRWGREKQKSQSLYQFRSAARHEMA